MKPENAIKRPKNWGRRYGYQETSVAHADVPPKIVLSTVDEIMKTPVMKKIIEDQI